MLGSKSFLLTEDSKNWSEEKLLSVSKLMLKSVAYIEGFRQLS